MQLLDAAFLQLHFGGIVEIKRKKHTHAHTRTVCYNSYQSKTRKQPHVVRFLRKCFKWYSFSCKGQIVSFTKPWVLWRWVVFRHLFWSTKVTDCVCVYFIDKYFVYLWQKVTENNRNKDIMLNDKDTCLYLFCNKKFDYMYIWKTHSLERGEIHSKMNKQNSNKATI